MYRIINPTSNRNTEVEVIKLLFLIKLTVFSLFTKYLEFWKFGLEICLSGGTDPLQKRFLNFIKT